jgi:hypothetical protein
MFWFLLSRDPKSDRGLRLKALAGAVGQARKLARLGKTGNEVLALRKLIQFEGDPVDTTINIVGKVGLANYWLFDNLSWLTKINVLKYTPQELESMNYWANFGWFWGVLAKLVVDLKALQATSAEEARLRSTHAANMNAAASDEKQVEALVSAYRQGTANLQAKRSRLTLNIIGSAGDLIVAGNAIQLPLKYLGYQLNDGVVGAAGLTSGVLTGYLAWQDMFAKKK